MGADPWGIFSIKSAANYPIIVYYASQSAQLNKLLLPEQYLILSNPFIVIGLTI